MARWLRRGALALLIVVPILLVAGFGSGWWLMRGSLAALDGRVQLPGLSAPVDIERDALGVVTVHAANELDALRALGYVHGQERFFEMDLMRRSAAGELSELFGPAALDLDKQHRVHRFRERALENLADIAGDKVPQLQAYTDGVNAGLADLRVRPWPYLLIGVKPEPWQLSDTPLVGYSMFFELQGGDNERELALWRIRQHLPAALWALVSRDGTSWDAPLEGQPRGDAVLPDAATLDLRKLPMPDVGSAKKFAESTSPGSNNFAVSGALTKDGRAIVAGDMHLNLRVPGIWFRARLLYEDAKAQDGKVDVGGFTLPGIPAMVVGTNTHVAWAFTNSYGDWMDWVQDCLAPACASESAREEAHDETIHVKGAPDVVLRVVQRFEGTRMPDVTGTKEKLSLAWTAHEPGAMTLGLLDMAFARDRDDGLQRLGHAGLPEQNGVLVDRSGHIGWTIAGRIPESPSGHPPSCDRMLPARFVLALPMTLPPPGVRSAKVPRQQPPAGACTSYGQGRVAWRDANPTIVDPPSGRLWTANNRVVDGNDLAVIGDGGYTSGARAKQIRDDLFAKDTFTEKDLLAIQLDDRALFLQRWWQLLQDESAQAKTPALRGLAAAASHWDGRADPSSVSYRLVRAWRLEVLARVRDGLLAPAEAALGKDFVMPDLPQLEGVAWPLVTQRPAHLLSRRFAECTAQGAGASACGGTTGWDALFEDAAKEVHDDVGGGVLARHSWGERNTADICHPLARALPGLFKRWLCMPPDELPGDAYMPRVATPDFGASERMVVSPGREADGIVEMPGGQSDNPLSPFWGAGHEAWVHGEPTPFLPGPAAHTLHLLPER